PHYPLLAGKRENAGLYNGDAESVQGINGAHQAFFPCCLSHLEAITGQVPPQIHDCEPSAHFPGDAGLAGRFPWPFSQPRSEIVQLREASMARVYVAEGWTTRGGTAAMTRL